jgi:hypothetical protein
MSDERPTEEDQRLVRRLRLLAAYRPALERHVQFGEWAGGQRQSDGAIQMPWYSFSDEAQRFLRDVSRAGWVQPFDWPKWLSTKRAQQLLGDTSAIAEATVKELSQLLTALIRQDRFAEGTLAGAYESGILAAVARRAEALAAALDRNDTIGAWSRRPWGHPWSNDRELMRAALAITEIGLARDMCYGPCPVYSVSLHRDGRAVYVGERFVDLVGDHQASVERTDFDTLALAVAHLRFGNLRRQYAVDFTDAQTTTTWAVRSGRRKTVQDYGGAGPHRLRQVEGLIDDAAAELKWQRVGGDRRPESIGKLLAGLPVDDDWRPPLEQDERPHWTQAGQHLGQTPLATPGSAEGRK